MKTGIIGMGNMGSKYAELIAKGEIAGMELVAVTRVSDERWDRTILINSNDSYTENFRVISYTES